MSRVVYVLVGRSLMKKVEKAENGAFEELKEFEVEDVINTSAFDNYRVYATIGAAAKHVRSNEFIRSATEKEFHRNEPLFAVLIDEDDFEVDWDKLEISDNALVGGYWHEEYPNELILRDVDLVMYFIMYGETYRTTTKLGIFVEPVEVIEE